MRKIRIEGLDYLRRALEEREDEVLDGYRQALTDALDGLEDTDGPPIDTGELRGSGDLEERRRMVRDALANVARQRAMIEAVAELEEA